MVGLYEEQWKEGRLFLHEHPAIATSWDLEELKKLEAKTGAHIYVADQCMYGLETWAEDKKVMMPARKPYKFHYKFLRNRFGIAEKMRWQSPASGIDRRSIQVGRKVSIRIVQSNLSRTQHGCGQEVREG